VPKLKLLSPVDVPSSSEVVVLTNASASVNSNRVKGEKHDLEDGGDSPTNGIAVTAAGHYSTGK